MSTLDTIMVLMWAVLGNLFGGYTPSGVSLSNRNGFRALAALALSRKGQHPAAVRVRKGRGQRTTTAAAHGSVAHKAARKAAARLRAARKAREISVAKYVQRMDRKAAMSHVTAANAVHEAKARGRKVMAGKSWQDAIAALYNEGRLVSVRSKGVVSPAAVGNKAARVTVGKNFLVVKAGIKSIAQKDAEYVSMHKVVGSKTSTAPTWSMWRKVVPIGRVLLLVQRRDAAVEKANRMAIKALERHLKIAAWEAVQAAKKVAA